MFEAGYARLAAYGLRFDCQVYPGQMRAAATMGRGRRWRGLLRASAGEFCSLPRATVCFLARDKGAVSACGHGFFLFKRRFLSCKLRDFFWHGVKRRVRRKNVPPKDCLTFSLFIRD